MGDARPDGVDELVGLLTLEEIDVDLYRGEARAEGPGRVFGGQVVAQALAAATASIQTDQRAHSLHAYFLRAGDTTRPIIYRVARDFDGGSFANRRVVAMQNGKPILNLAASFQRPEDGPGHAAAVVDVPGPENSIPILDAIRARGGVLPEAIADRLNAFDFRAGLPADAPHSSIGAPTQHAWFHLKRKADLDPAMARAVLAYASDFGLISVAVMAQSKAVFAKGMQVASLDHALWFHETPPVDDWLLYAMDSPWSGHGRGIARGMVYDRSGRLVATVAQEGLIRER